MFGIDICTVVVGDNDFKMNSSSINVLVGAKNVSGSVLCGGHTASFLLPQHGSSGLHSAKQYMR